MLRAAIVGCGLIGWKRAQSLQQRAVLSACCDLDLQRAETLARGHGAAASADWEATVARPDVDAVFISTTHNMLAPIAAAAVGHGKHVLIEKPGARCAADLDPVALAAERTGALVRIGFNHRLHRAFRKAREICDSGALGDLFFIRGRYGHGGRLGYEREWRASPRFAGGGEAIDQGIHLLDLARWFLGDLSLVGGRAPTYFWKMPVEDNAFFLLETQQRQVAFLQASWTEWKNLFSFEICGRNGKLEINGLGGSYGTESLVHYQMQPSMGPPPATTYQYPMPDDSWEVSTSEFFEDIRLGRAPEPGIKDAQAALATHRATLPTNKIVIITRSPLRISLGGGGTDLPSYYREHGGFVLSAAIDKYVYITLHQTFFDELIIKYSQLERVKKLEDIQHPLIREALRLYNQQASYLEITSMSDIPAGTGLGSSGSFLTALLHALHIHTQASLAKRELAEQACHIEIERLSEPVGKQDPYIAAFGGITCFEFKTDGTISVHPLKLSLETLANLEDNLLLFYTGYTRSASEILREQDTRTKSNDAGMLDNLHFVKELGLESRKALEAGDLRRFAELMHVHWQHKKKRSGGMTNDRIDTWYEQARNNGALGGKLIGAGGGGFLMFYTEEKTRLRHAMRAAGARELRVRFDFQGTTAVIQS